MYLSGSATMHTRSAGVDTDGPCVWRSKLKQNCPNIVIAYPSAVEFSFFVGESSKVLKKNKNNIANQSNKV